MSDFAVPVVRVGRVEKHPNADSLGITRVYDFPVIVRLGDVREGDLAIYVPVDAIVPATRPQRPERIRAKRLRGVFSMGLLVRADVAHVVPRELAIEGADVAEPLGIVKWEEPEPVVTDGESAPAPRGVQIPTYAVESYRRWPDVLRVGELVVVTEKIHGCNARFVVLDGVLHVGTHRRWVLADGETIWARAARENDLAKWLAARPGLVFYGEVFGQVQDLTYGHARGVLSVRFFDVLDARTGMFLDYLPARLANDITGVNWVPILARGPWSPDLLALADGKSTIAEHIREGCVIRPEVERRDDAAGRVILKHVSEAYLTRKGGTEHH